VIYAVAVATYGRLARALSPTPLRP
jgi:hypothetical protein